MRVASQRLIDAAATLGPSDRSLLSLLINHGLDDDALARMTHSTPAAIQSRRAQLVAHISDELGLPPETVREAIGELATSAQAHAAAELPSPWPARESSEPAMAGEGSDVRRRPRRLSALLLLLVVAIVALIVALSSGGGTHRKRPSRAMPGAGSASVPSARATLAPLPGGPVGVTGSLTITDASARPRLVLNVSGLPPSGSGYYELWLYNSIIDSTPLARLTAPASSVTVALPPDYRRFQWLDISLEPAGAVNHSGESILRAAVPG